MNDTKRNEMVLNISKKIIEDKTSIDEQDPKIINKYVNFAMTFGAEKDEATEIVGEAFLYLKMQESSDIDPVRQGNQFGAGFS